MSSTFKKKEKTPEALLERLKNATSPDDYFELFEDLWTLIMGIISKADADAGTRTQAIDQFGTLSGRFYLLIDAYKIALEHDFSYKDNLHDEIEDVLKKLIEVYARLKKGESLRKAIDTISWTSLSAHDAIRDFMNRLAEMIEDLSPRPYYW